MAENQLTIRISPDLKAAASAFGEQQGKSLSAVVHAALRSYLGLDDALPATSSVRFADAALVEELSKKLATLQATVDDQAEKLETLTARLNELPTPGKSKPPEPRHSKVRVGARLHQ